MDDKQRSNWVFSETAETFKEHARRIDRILADVRKKFVRDYTGMTGTVGTLVLLSTTAMVLYDKPSFLTVVLAMIGSVLLLAALIVRHKISKSQLRCGDKMMELERERARSMHKSIVFHNLWLYGIPEGTPLAQIQVILGDTSSLSPDELARMTWKQLTTRPDALTPSERPLTDSQVHATTSSSGHYAPRDSA